MAKTKTVDRNVEEIKKLMKEGKIIIGTKTVIKSLRNNSIEKVFLASNCKAETVDEIEHGSKLNSIPVVRIRYPNDELGVICKKPFSISALAISR